MTKKVLITGATGFIGRHVLAQCAERGYSVKLVVRPGWQAKLSALPAHSDVIEVEDLFLQDQHSWGAFLEGVDTIIHSAWFAVPGEYLTSDKNLECLAGTKELAKAAAQAGVNRFVGLGTCIEYELANDILTPQHPLAPQTEYARAKVATYQALNKIFAQSEASFLWCRLFQPYGEGEDPRRLFPYLHRQLSQGLPVELGAGTQIRDFIEAGEAGRQILEGTTSDYQGAANISTGQGQSIRDFATRIAKSYGREDLLNFGARSDSPNDWPMIVGQKAPFA